MTEQPLRNDDLPSTKTLLRSTAIAVGVATVVLIVFVLPAEYGVDPTGIGGALGLTQMGAIKASHEAGDAPAAPVPEAKGPRKDVTKVTLKPGGSFEVKLAMRKDARAKFVWSTDTGVVSYDLHSDHPTNGYHGYKKGTAVAADEGVLVAAFDGIHGWWWRNRTDGTLTITLETDGDYQGIKEIK